MTPKRWTLVCECSIVAILAVIVLLWLFGKSVGGEPPSIKELNDQILVTLLQREGYADSTIKMILELPRLDCPLAIPDTLLQLDESAADDLITNFGTRLRISDDGRWAGICTLAKYKDEKGWHICMDVKILYPKDKKL